MSRSRLALLPLEPRAGIESDYDRARRELLRYEQILRRSSERVESLAEQLRRKHDRESSRALPQTVLRLRGPVGGVTGGRLVIVNAQSRALDLELGPFHPWTGEGGGQPRVELRPGSSKIPARQRSVVTLILDFGPTSYAAGALVCAPLSTVYDASVELRVAIEVELFAA